MDNLDLNPQIAILKWLFEDVRKITLKGIEPLTKEQLFAAPIEGEECIGAFLMHLCECDLGWYQTISGKEASEDIKKRAYYAIWYDSPEAAPPAEPPEVREYLETMAATRKLFLDYVCTLKDSDLDDVITWKNKQYTKRWVISRMLQHEAHTRGQIMMLIRKAGWEKGDLWEQRS
jgi:uncharacterized damage-inducible protein DinB